MSYFSTSNFVDPTYNNRDHECPSNQPISDSNVDWQISKQLFSSEASSTLSTNNNLPTQHLQPTVFYGDFPPVLNNEEKYENCRGTFSSQSCDVGNAVHLFPTFSQPDYMNCRTSSVPSSGSLACEAENVSWSVMENRPNELMLPSNSASAFYTNNSSQQLFTSPISPADVIDLTQSPRVDEQVKEQSIIKSHLHDGLDLNISNSNIMLHPTVKPTSDLGSELEAVTSEENIVDSPCFSSFSCLETFDYKNSPEKKMTYPSNDTDLSKFIDVPIEQNYQDNKPNETTPRIELANRELWQKFFEIGTEMIITKAGRRMFPAIKLEVVDLKPNSYYIMAVDITPVDNNRYRYVYHSSQWMAAGTTDAHPAPRTYIHPDSPCRGEVWMRQAITFDKLKLTNHEANKKGHIILNSMHKYQPRVHVIECHGNIPVNLTHFLPRNKRIDDVMLRDRTTAVFPECVFTTVTAYQNQQITKLKIDRNPFAKGFRETNKHWHNSSAESRVIQCQAKELERNRNEANPKFYNNSASYLAHTDDDSKSWQQSLSRDMDSNNIHFVDPGRDENVLLPMQHSYMEINSQYLDIDSETIPEVDDLDPEVLPEAESSFYDLLSDTSNVET